MKCKKIISIVLCCALFFSMTPCNAYAASDVIDYGMEQNIMDSSVAEDESISTPSDADDEDSEESQTSDIPTSDVDETDSEESQLPESSESDMDTENTDASSEDGGITINEISSSDVAEPTCPESESLEAGDTYSIVIDNLAEDAIVSYSTLAENPVVSVDNDGVVTALKYGKGIVNIQVTQNDKQYFLEITVYVHEILTPQLEGNVYKISSAPELAWIASEASAGNTFAGYTVELQNDIDLEGPEWRSIGYNLNNFFAGTFDGQNHTLKNFGASGSVDSYSIINAPRHTTGLFGVCIGATIKNLVVEKTDFSISNESGYQNSYSSINGTCVYGGVVSGYADNCSFSNIIIRNSNVTVYTGAESAYAYAGGIVGYARKSDFAHCGNENGTISGKSDSLNNDALAGGIIGELENEGVVRQCYNTSDIYGGASISGAYTGGIAGKTSNSSNTLSTVRDCYNQGQVYHSGSWLETAYIGGIIGYSSSTINRCYNSGVVYANTNTVSSALLGGIAGSGISSSSISNSAVMSSQISGGTSRYVISGAGVKENNIAYSNLTATNDATSTYDIDKFYGESLYSEKLSWDFSYIWLSYENQYPELRYIDSEIEEDIQIVDEAAKEVRIIFANGDTYDKVTNNIELKGATNGATVSWESTNEIVLSSATGVVNRQLEDYLVKIIANISSGNYSVKKTFVLNVIGTESTIELVTEEWGLSVDSARAFVAYMRGCKFKDVSVEDPDVLVLTGADTDEEHVADTLVKVMHYWEVPNESEYLKSQIGDVVGLIKAGDKEVISSIIGDEVGDFLDGVTKEKVVSKVFSKFFNNVYDTIAEYLTGYEAVKNGDNYEFTEKGTIWKALSWGDLVGEVISFIVGHSDGSRSTYALTGSKIMGYFKNTITAFKLIGAWNDELQNSTKSYLRMYCQNRGMFDSADDEAFKLIMSAIDISNIIGNEVALNEVGEALFQLNEKFGGNPSDQYKITIKCPVDVVVYDESGKIVGRVTSNEIDNTVDNSLFITVSGINNDEKTIYFQDAENYTISLMGNDNGMMSIEIECQKSGAKSTYSYNDIVLSNNKKMDMSVSTENVSDEGQLPVITVIEDGIESDEIEAVDSNVTEYRLDINSCIENPDGTIILSAIGGYCASCYVSPGTALIPLITINNGYLLEGIYTDPQCINKYDGFEMPDYALNLYAKFKINETGITILSQPEDNNYFLGDEADALEVKIESGANCNFQWYSFTDTKENAVEINGANSLVYYPSTEKEGVVFYFLRISYYSGNDLIYLDSDSARIAVEKKPEYASGDCGDSLNWSLTTDGILKIYGNGAMYEFDSITAPWNGYLDKIISIKVADGVTSIGNNAFIGCNNLESVEIPDSVERIGLDILSNCNSLEEISIPFIGSSRDVAGTSDAVLGHLFGTSSSGVLQCYMQSGNSLSGYKYAIPNSLRKVSITDAKTIPFGAFYNCANLTSVELNEGITEIQGYSFRNCTGLTEMTIPKSVQSVAEYTLDGCNNIETLTVPFVGANREVNGTYEGALGYIFGRCSKGDNNCVLQYTILEGTSLSGYYYGIPDELKTVIVTDATQLPIGSFSNLKNVMSLTLNSGITEIGAYAFYNVTGLKDIYYLDWESEWNKITIGNQNTVLNDVTIHFLGPETTNSVDITWGALEYTYSDGIWNTSTHKYEDGGWTVNAEDGDVISVTNKGDKEVTISIDYHTERSDIAGIFDTEPIAMLNAGELKKWVLQLSGKPNEDLNNAVIGQVSVTIGGD